MKRYRFVFETVLSSDVASIQKKINQWVTTGLYKKHRVTPVGDSLFFEIILYKEAI